MLLPPRLRLRKIIILVLLPKPDRRKIDFAIRNPLLHLAAQIKKRAWIAELAWIAAFAAVASITSGARDFMIYAVALLFGKGVFAGILEKLWGYLHGGNIPLFDGGIRQLSTFARESHLTASDFYHLAYFGGFTAVFIHQYLTIKTKNSVALLIAVIVVVSLLQMLGGMPANSSGAP